MLLPACTSETPPAELPATDTLRTPDQESWNARYLIDEGQRPRMQIDAEYLARYNEEDSTLIHLSGSARVHVQLYDERGDSSAVLRADQIRYNEDVGRMTATGDVVVRSRTGRVLETERLVWMEATGRVRSDGFVQIQTEDEDIRGYGLRATEDLSTYQLGRVTGVVYREASDE